RNVLLWDADEFPHRFILTGDESASQAETLQTLCGCGSGPDYCQDRRGAPHVLEITFNPKRVSQPYSPEPATPRRQQISIVLELVKPSTQPPLSEFAKSESIRVLLLPLWR